MSDDAFVPEDWEVGTLEEVAAHITDGTHMPPPRQSVGRPLLSAKDIAVGSLQAADNPRLVSETFFESELERTQLAEGDVLVTIVGSIGRSTVVPPNPNFALQRSVAIVKPDAVTSEYLSLYLRSPAAHAFYRARGRGTAQQGIYLRDLRQLPVPYPTQEEQQRLTQAIEVIDSKRNAVRQRLRSTARLAERLRKAILIAACSGRLTTDWRATHSDSAEELSRELRSTSSNPPAGQDGLFPEDLPQTWRMATGADVFTFVTSGSRGWAKYYSDAGPAFLRVGNLDRYRLDLDLRNVRAVTPPPTAESKRTRVQPGDLLISITAEVGMVGVVPDDLGEGYVNQHVAIARPHQRLNGRFLAAFVAAPAFGEAQLDALQRGATKAGLGLNDIRALVIPMPPVAEQVEIARRVDLLMALADTIETRIQTASRSLDRSSHAVLAKAFRGELLSTPKALLGSDGIAGY